MNDISWEKYFPYESPRDLQKKAINRIEEFLRSDKKYFILEAGTGVGKSAIGLTAAKINEEINPGSSEDFSQGSYFITTQKILQDQYVKDFSSSGIKSIKSSSNYSCKFHKKNTCAQSMRVLMTAEKGSRFWNTCAFRCPYKIDKNEFLESNLSVTNFPYFLAESTYAKKIQPRKLLIIDEAHNVSNELGKFVEISFTENFCKKFLNISFLKTQNQKKALDWVLNVYHPKLRSKFKFMKNKLDEMNISNKIDQFVSLSRQFELIDKHLCKVNRFLENYSEENWVLNCVENRKLEFKPVDVSHFSKQMLLSYGQKVIMMSATILNKEGFCEILGIDKKDCDYMNIDSPFEKKNRPILFFPVGKMSKKNIDNTLPYMAEAIDKILKNHSSEKGIIHCHTFKIAKFLKEKVKSRRILIHNSENREQVLEKHKKSKSPTVLLSPSMTEGVDLAGECSRFQVICKMPYPYLGDKIVNKRMKKWPWWYSMQTSKTIVQSVGRSIRNEEDYAITYILDEDWDYFYSRNSKFLPDDFKSCIK